MALSKKQQESIEKAGWWAHIVPSGDNTPFGYNYHTHNFEEKFNHLNIQIVYPLPPDLAHALILDVIENIIEAKVKIQVGQKYEGVMANYKVEFIRAVETGRNVWRMVLPDANGGYSGKFAKQFEMLNNE